MSNDPIEKRLREVIIGEIEPQSIVVVDYDPAWPERFRREEARIRSSLGEAALSRTSEPPWTPTPRRGFSLRDAYQGPWNSWNGVRTLLSLAAFLTLVGACLMRGSDAGRGRTTDRGSPARMAGRPENDVLRNG
jgi:hypothetical protein